MALAMVSRREIVSGSNLIEVTLLGICVDYMVVNRTLIIYRVVRPRGYLSPRMVSCPLGFRSRPPDTQSRRGGVSLCRLSPGRHFKYGSICLNSGRRLLPSNS